MGRALIALLLFWVPLAFYARSADGFVLPKEWVALGGGLLILGLTLSQIPSLLRHPLTVLLCLFVFWMLVDGFMTASDPLSVWNGSAYLGVILITFLAVIAAPGLGISYEKMMHGVLAAGVLTSAYGLSQTLGADSLNWNTHFEKRAFSTLGNPDYLAGYLVALLPMAFLLTLRSSGKRAWFGYRAITFLLFTALLMTRVRGSLLALAVALVVLTLGLGMPWGRELAAKNKKTLLIAFAILVAGGAAYWFRYGGWNAFEWGQASVQQRLQTYRVGMEMLKDHPLTGIGLGQLGRVYPLYQWRPFSAAEWPSHPVVLTEHLHNEFLQMAVEGGWIGLGFFFLVLAAYITKVFRIISDPGIPIPTKELLLGILASLAALLGQALTNFPFQVIPTGVLFGFFLAAPLALNSTALPFKAISKLKAYWVLLGILFLAGGAWATKCVAASIALRNTVGETNLGHASLAGQFATRLAQLAPGDPNAWNAVAKARELNQQREGAVDAYNLEMALNPNSPQAYLSSAQDEIQLGHTDEALSLCQKCLSMIPNDSQVLWLEGVCYFKLNRFEDAAHDFEKFLPWAPRDESLYVNLGVCYVKSGRKKNAIEAWKKAHELNPADPQAIQYLKTVGVRI